MPDLGETNEGQVIDEALISDIVSDASDLQKEILLETRVRPAPDVVVGELFRKYGQAEIRSLLGKTEDPGMALDMAEWVTRMDAARIFALIEGVSKLIDGVLYPAINRASVEGWSLQKVCDTFNAYLGGTCLPKISPAWVLQINDPVKLDEQVRIQDEEQTHIIQEALLRERTPRYFFENIRNIMTISPVSTIITGYPDELALPDYATRLGTFRDIFKEDLINYGKQMDEVRVRLSR